MKRVCQYSCFSKSAGIFGVVDVFLGIGSQISNKKGGFVSGLKIDDFRICNFFLVEECWQDVGRIRDKSVEGIRRLKNKNKK